MSEVPNAAPTEELRISLLLRRLSLEIRRFMAGMEPATLATAERTALAFAM